MRAQLNPQISWEITRGLALSVEAVEAAAAIRLRWLATLADLFTRFDALVLPATQIWPFPVSWDWPREIAGQGMDSYHRWMEVVVPASLAGVPAVALPAGFGSTGLPGGVQMIGPAGGDAALLALAARYEEAIGPRAIRDPV
jgi:amidase